MHQRPMIDSVCLSRLCRLRSNCLSDQSLYCFACPSASFRCIFALQRLLITTQLVGIISLYAFSNKTVPFQDNFSDYFRRPSFFENNTKVILIFRRYPL